MSAAGTNTEVSFADKQRIQQDKLLKNARIGIKLKTPIKVALYEDNDLCRVLAFCN